MVNAWVPATIALDAVELGVLAADRGSGLMPRGLEGGDDTGGHAVVGGVDARRSFLAPSRVIAPAILLLALLGHQPSVSYS